MSEKGCNCNCAQNREEQFKELSPVLEQYAKVPGSLITILQKTQDIYCLLYTSFIASLYCYHFGIGINQ